MAAIAEHRNDFDCQHAVVVGPDFPTGRGEESALAKRINDDREKYSDESESEQRTITLIRIDDLAKLVRLAPLRNIWPSKLRDLFQTCSLPEESHEWIERETANRPKQEPYRQILKTIWNEQKQEPNYAVKYSVIRVLLRARSRPIKRTDDQLRELCRGMAALAPGRITARDETVELEVPPVQVLEAIDAATEDLDPEER